MDETKTYVFGQDGSLASILAPMLSQRGIDPSVLAMMNNGGFGGTNSWFIWVIFLFFLMGWGGNGFGFNRGGDGTSFLANQLSNDTGRDLLLQAINGNGSAISQLASNLNIDLSAIQSALTSLTAATTAVGSKVDLSGAQVINAVQSGDAALASQLAQCCCENRLLTTTQGYESQIRTLEQTNQLGAQADRNANSIIGAINAQTVAMNDQFCQLKERELQDKIDLLNAQNTTLRNQIDNANQTAAITSYINSVVTPIQNQVNTIASKQPNTVAVEWPNLTAVNNTPYMGSIYYGSYYPYSSQGSIWA